MNMNCCMNCKHCKDDSFYNRMMGIAIIGVPMSLFGNHDLECENHNSPKYGEEVTDETVCDFFEKN